MAFFNAAYSGKNRSTCAHMKIRPACSACGNHTPCGNAIQRHRLFHQDVLAGLQCRHCHLFVQEGWQAEIHGIDIGVAQDPGQIPVQLDPGEIQALARASQIALGGGQVAG